MKKLIAILILTYCFTPEVFSQKNLDKSFPQKKMTKDLSIFRKIRDAANSGVYKYRTPNEMDSIYRWANGMIEESATYGDFYNILWQITDFEGSLHNSVQLHYKMRASLRAESAGYFPYPVKIIEGKMRLNFTSAEIPVGSEIFSINGKSVGEILPNFYKYYTTDGFNLTGKEIGINRNFSRYYRLYYGKSDRFSVDYKLPESTEIKTVVLSAIGYKAYYENFESRHSKSHDDPSYSNDEEEKPYSFEFCDETIGKLTINSFSIGGHARDPEHITYTHFLDSVFDVLEDRNTKNLIVDVRHNGGGSDPNDLVTYSYLTSRNFVENTEAWISFRKIPYWKYVKEVSFLMKPIERYYSDKELMEEFPDEKNGRFYEDSASHDHMIRTPKENAFNGRVYLLISPRTASAGSLFAAMVAGNDNTFVIGEETQGGYYGHNGHIPIRYRLPKSKIKFMFSLVNLNQDVPEKKNQPFGSGVMPDHQVRQSFEDFMSNRDTQLNYTLRLIKRKR